MAHKNIEARNDYRKKWREANKDKVQGQRIRYKTKKNINKPQPTPKIAKVKIKKERVKKERIKLTPEQIKAKKQLYYEKNKEKLLQSQKEWREINKDKIRSQQNEKYKSNSLYKLKTNIKNLIGNSLRKNNITKLSKTEIILGCSYEQLKQYLESKFESWMCWDNRGLYKKNTYNYGWDIDHIIPLDTAITTEDVIRLNHYTNLQPLCSYINRDIKRNIVISTLLCT